MIEKQRIRKLMSTLDAYKSPMLSLYMSVNPAQRGNGPRSIVLRAKSALNRLAGIPSSVKEKVLARLEHEVPAARTLAIFASEEAIDLFAFPFELPLQEPPDGQAEARWGEPYIFPLLAALEPHPTYGVMFVDREHWRFFAVAQGTIEEIASEQRALSQSEYDTLEQSKPEFPAYMASRGGAAKDLAERHIKELSRRFYQAAAGRLSEIVNERELEALIAVGPERDIARFREVLTPQLEELIAATVPSLRNPRCSADQVRLHVAPTIEKLESERESKLLFEIEERGITGLNACLIEMQRGRLHKLAVPWDLEIPVFRERNTGYVSTTLDGARTYRPDDPDIGEVPLRVVLPELACEYNTQIEFLHGLHGERLIRDLGGMGALPRWR